jgi:dipeptidyl aminopeptidase/acylaminoacyl peptidase
MSFRNALFVLAVLVPGSAGLFAASARAELPPLIPREILMGNPAQQFPQISPDGKRLSYLAPAGHDVLNIWIEPLGGGKPEMVTADTLRGIFSYRWAEDNQHLIYIQDQAGDENWHVHSVDLASREVKDLTPYEGVAAQNIYTDPNHPNEILVELNQRDKTKFDLHRIDLRTGTVTMEAQNPGDVSEWATDHDFRVRACTALDAQTNDTIIRVRDTADGPWRDIARWPFMEAGEVLARKVLGFTPDGKGLYVQSCMGVDKLRLVVLDVATGKQVKVLAENPDKELWNLWWEPQIVMNPHTRTPEAVAFYYFKPEWKVLDAKVKKDFDLLAKDENTVFQIVGRDQSDRKWIVDYTSDVTTDRYYLYDRDSGKLDLIFDSQPKLAEYKLAHMEGKTFKARDGRTVPCYLTLPVGVTAKNLPLILNVHGGPWAQDYWGYDPWTQLFANRGYAVLQVNYRGSTGYGKDHINAGIGQWGVGGMQNDLTDAVQWAIKQGIADPKRVGIVGGSYGGYATLAGLAFTPQVYACGVDIVGPSDVKTLFQSFPPYWAVRKVRWIRRVGDVEHDDALNQRISPLYHADAIKAPLLIAQGANDPRVKQVNSDTIAAAIRKNGGSVQYILYPDEGHGMARPQNNMDFMGRAEEFLAQYLGGRKEPWRAVPGSSAQVQGSESGSIQQN